MSPLFDHEHLSVYQAAIGFVAWLEGIQRGITRRASARDHLRRAAAVKWYEMRRISQGKAAELCGVSRAQFMGILGDYRVSILQDDPGSLAAEVGS